MTQDLSVASAAPLSRFSGAGKIFLGFVVGALFGLAPVYYFYMGREAGLRSAGVASEAADLSPRSEPSPPAHVPAGHVFASRMTYELRNAPAEPPAAPPPPMPVAVAVATASAGSQPAPVPAIVVDPRPISAIPPPARDRTAAIEREAQRTDYREPAAPPPRVIEGREVKLPGTPTRPIVPGTDLRAEIEDERRRLSAEVARAWPAPGEAPPRQITVASAQRSTAEEKSRTATPEKAVAATAAASAPAAGSARDGAPEAGPSRSAASVDGRLSATRHWLSASEASTHTIQLMGTHNEEHLKGSLRSLSKLLDTEKIYLFRTVAQGKPAITVVYGSFNDRQSALQALEKLPPSIAANKPVLRTVNGIRAEMKQHKTGG